MNAHTGVLVFGEFGRLRSFVAKVACIAAFVYFLGTLFEIVRVYAIPAPRVAIDSVKKDLGSVCRARTVSVAFKIVNKGSRLLRVTGVQTGCGSCLSAKTTFPIEILPGEHRAVMLELDTTHLSGRFEKDCVFISNDPKQPAILVRVAGVVEDSDRA